MSEYLNVPAMIDEAMAGPKPATALLHLFYVEHLDYGTAARIWKRVYGAEADVQDAAEREAAPPVCDHRGCFASVSNYGDVCASHREAA